MLVAIDVGNTNIVIGIYDGKKLIGFARLATRHDRTADETGFLIEQTLNKLKVKKEAITGAIICSVVPPIMYSLEHAIRYYLGQEPLIVSHRMNTGIDFKIDSPRDLGTDNIANAVAAIDLYGGNLIVVDFGTATTFSAITKNGEYLGGAICPGVRVAIEALAEKTAKLPWVDLVKPQSVIGKNTVDCIQSGAIYGYAGQVDAIVGRMKKELGKDAKAIATGGLSGLIVAEAQTIDEINKELTLEGLRILYERQHN